MSAYCGECGYYLSPEDIFCGNCGTKREQNTYQNQSNENHSFENLEFETNYQKVLYSYHGLSIALLSKLAKIDGRVCEKEANYIKVVIAQFTSKYYENRFLDSYDKKINNLEKIYKEIVKKEKNSISNISDLCVNLNSPYLYKEQKVELIKKLVALAHVDNSYSTEEENFIIKVLNLIHLDYSVYKDIVVKYSKEESDNNKEQSSSQNNQQNKKNEFNGHLSLDEAYKVLELQKSATNSEIKQQYKKLARQYHYDSLTSKDLPKDLIDFAEEKLKMINAAYELLKNTKGI